MSKRFVVCAAIKLDDTIICGARHFDMIMHKQIAKYGMPHRWKNAEQGFIDQKGLFMNRKEALECAKNNNQIKGHKHSPAYELFSEDLY